MLKKINYLEYVNDTSRIMEEYKDYESRKINVPCEHNISVQVDNKEYLINQSRQTEFFGNEQTDLFADGELWT